MKNSISGWMMVFLCLLSISVFAQDNTKTEARIIVQFRLSAFSRYISQLLSDLDNLSARQPLLVSQIVSNETINKLTERLDPVHMSSISKLKDLVLFHYENLSESEMSIILKLLNNNPLVEYAEPDYKIKGTYIPTDKLYGSQWQMIKIGMEQVWEHSCGSEDVIVAVLDSGVDYTHPDLFQSLVTGYDFCNGDDDPYDDAYDSYHGTHVTGIIASRGNNDQGIAGIAWNIKVMPLKILDQDLDGNVSVAVKAIEHAIAEGAHIINMSWSEEDEVECESLKNAIQLAWDTKKIICVAAAGNGKNNLEGKDLDEFPLYPACFNLENIITVASTDGMESDEENLSSFSNYSDIHVDLAAPGASIISTIGQNRYQTRSGTSMAAPHVSGAVAIIKSVYPGLSSSEIISAIINNVDPLPTLEGKVKTGGRLNVYNALLSIGGTLPVDIPEPEPPPTPTPKPIIDLLLKYQCGDPQETTSNMKIFIQITSRDIIDINLSDLIIRYYYTKDGISDEEIVIDYSSSIQISDIIATPMEGYINIGFTENAGVLKDTDSIRFHLRMYKLDFTNYDQSNDYSFEPLFSDDYYYFKKITMFYKDDKIWGYGPDDPIPTLTPTPTPGPTETLESTPGPTSTPTPFSTGGPTPEVILGDVNSDGIIDIIDALLVAQYYVGLDPQGFNPSAADVDCNEKIDVIDALVISQYYVGLITEFCNNS